jgi:hypothetical protein
MLIETDDASAAQIRAARPYALLVIAWLLATNQVLSRSAGPDSIGPPQPGAPEFQPSVVLMQPAYTLFYTVVLAALFAMAWMEHEEIFGAASVGSSARGERFAAEVSDRFSSLADDDHLYHFLLQSALVFAFGLVAAFLFGAYLKRIRPPKDHKDLRQSVFYFCVFQLAVACAVVASYSAFANPTA